MSNKKDNIIQMSIDLPEDATFFPIISDEEDAKNNEEFNEVLPVLPLRNTILFPGVVIPITVGRNKSLKLVREAYKGNKIIGTVAQIDPNIEDPEEADLYRIGTVAQIIKVLEGDFNIADETIYEDGEQDNIQLAVQSLVWDRVNKEMTQILNSVTLEQLANEYRKLNADTRAMYYI